MGEFRAYYSRWRVAALLLLCLGFMMLGLLLAGVFGELPDPESWSGRRRRISPEVVRYVGWFCAAFSGACLPVIAMRLADDNVQLEIGQEGIQWSRWSDAIIPWTEIERVSVWSHQRQKHIIVHLYRPEAFPGRGMAARMARANRMLTDGDIGITLVGTDRSFDEARAAIAYFGGDALFR